MHPFGGIDWFMVVLPVVVVVVVGWKTQRHLKAVSDFTSGGRVAGRYLLAVASGEAGLGLISVIGVWEMYYNSGFAVNFWAGIAALVGLFLGLVGFCTYRFRETRCLTMAQFFEVRYSRGVRLYSGLLSAVSGVVNYAIFPAVGARFIMHYAHLPERLQILGVGFSTYGLLLTAALAVAFTMLWIGGQLTIMVTDCVQGILAYWIYMAIFVAVLLLMSWDRIAFALVTVPEPGQSMVNPFDILDKSDFNLYYVLIGVFGGVLNRMSWQGSQGYFSAARTAHEAKMAGILGTWRGMFLAMMLVLLAMVGYAYLNHPDFAPHADVLRETLVDQVDNPAVRTQLLVPMALSDLLPPGITGLMLAGMILLMISTDNTYLHSWGTIIFQDCLLPFTRRRFTPREHLMCLRMSALFVAVFAWMFSFYFGQTTYIFMFFALTGTIYLGGAGPCILGGLYWKRGTTAAAWTSLTVGGLLGVLGVVLSQPSLWRPAAAYLMDRLGWTFLAPYAERFPVNGQWLYFIAMVAALLLYVAVSLATCRRPFNLDRMLHRGDYAVAGEGGKARLSWSPRSLLGITAEFTRGDRALAWSVFLWSMLTWLVLMGAIGYNLLVAPWSDWAWADYFFYTSLCVPALLGVVTAVWFTVGGTRDLKALLRRLATLQRNDLDDGRVVGHVSAEDAVPSASGRHLADPEGPITELLEAAVPLRRISRWFLGSAALLAFTLFLPWLTVPRLPQEAAREARGLSEADGGRAFLDGLQAGDWGRSRYLGVELPWAGDLGRLLDSRLALMRREAAAEQAESAGQTQAALRAEETERVARVAYLESLSGKAAGGGEGAEAAHAGRLLREQWAWEEAYWPTEAAEWTTARRDGYRSTRRDERRTRFAQALRQAGGAPPRRFERESLDALDAARAADLLAALRDNEKLRAEHTARIRTRQAEEHRRLEAKAERMDRAALEALTRGDAGPAPGFPWGALLYVGPVLALAALILGWRGRAGAAHRFGTWAGLATGIAMWGLMLAFPERLGGYVAPGVWLAALAAFGLLTFSLVGRAGEPARERETP